MANVHYIPDFLSLEQNDIIDEIKKLNWCRPPSGIPGNRTPRNVAVLGNGSIIDNQGKLIETSVSSLEKTSYPLYQCAKDSYGIYQMRPIPIHLRKFILRLRTLVKEKFKNRAVNVDNMFNVIVCNYYTEHNHQINAHKDDERWLVNNTLVDGEMTSLIASLTLYPDDKKPLHLRNFQIMENEKWIDYPLENGSIILFSNQMHRAKPLSKKLKNIHRINLTFRTLHSDLLGLIGYGNFYRYMSLPESISVCDNKISQHYLDYFSEAVKEANLFNNKDLFVKFGLTRHQKSDINATKNLHLLKFNSLPSYVKSLCSFLNLKNISKKKITIKYRCIIK